MRHGNGRDWWLIISYKNSNLFEFFNISPEGIKFSHSEYYGPSLLSITNRHLIHKISEDGNYLAVVYQCNNISIFKIDRCLGFLEFINSFPIDENNCFLFDPFEHSGCRRSEFPPIGRCIGGFEFSPDARYIYVSKSTNLYQIDVKNKTVALIYGSNVVSKNISDIMQRFPNGKIYIDSDQYKSFNLHELNRPKLKGLSADMNVVAIKTNDSIYYRLNIWPDYFLGKQVGSVCDSL